MRPLLRRLEANQYHLKIVQSLVHERVEDHIQYVSMTGPILTVVVDSAAWATYLRPDSKRILTALQELGDYAHLQRVKIQVNPSTH